MRKAKSRNFSRYYMGTDGLRHVVPEGGIWAACGQSIVAVKYWGGGKDLTCIMCIGASS